MAIVTKDVPWPYDIELTDGCKKFIEKCLAKDPKDRYSATEALQDAWLKDKVKATNKPLGNKFKENVKNYSKAGMLYHLFDSRLVAKVGSFFFMCAFCLMTILFDE